MNERNKFFTMYSNVILPPVPHKDIERKLFVEFKNCVMKKDKYTISHDLDRFFKREKWMDL